MYFDPKMVKMFLVLVFLIAGAFVGIQLVSDSDVEELQFDQVTEETVDQKPEESEYELIESESSQADVPDPDMEVEVSSGLPTLSESLEGVEYEGKVTFDNGFKHTAPGEYSEIFVVAMGLPPGEKHTIYLKKVGSDTYEPGGHEVFPDEFGVINTRFRITSYGEWEVELGGSTGIHKDIVMVE